MKLSDLTRYTLMAYLVWEIIETPSYVLGDPLLTISAAIYILILVLAITGLIKKKSTATVITILDATLSLLTTTFYITTGQSKVTALAEPTVYLALSLYTYKHIKQ